MNGGIPSVVQPLVWVQAPVNTNRSYSWGGHYWISIAYQQPEAQYHLPREVFMHKGLCSRNLSLRLFVLLIALITIPQYTFAQQAVIDQPIVVNETGSRINTLKWSPDGQLLAVASDNGVQFYNQSLQPIGSLYQGTFIHGLSWSPSGSDLVLTNGTTLEIWNRNIATGEFTIRTTLLGENTQIGVFWSPDTSRILAVEAFEVDQVWLGSFAIWDAYSWQLERRLGELYGFEMDFSTSHRVDWSPDSTPFIVFAGYRHRLENNTYVVDDDSTVYVINVETGGSILNIPMVAGPASAVSWQPSGNLIAVGTTRGLGVYRIGDNQYVRPIGNPFPTGSAAWDPTGRYIAGDSGVSDITTGQFLGYFQADTGIRTIAWHPNGTMLTTADIHGTIKIENLLLLPDFNPEPTFTPIATATLIDTFTPAFTPTFTPTSTHTATLTHTSTHTPTPTNTHTDVDAYPNAEPHPKRQFQQRDDQLVHL